MIRLGRKKSLMSFIFKPICITVLLVGLFNLVWLKSHVLDLEYSIGVLEKMKADHIRERRLLLAEKAGLQSLERLETSATENRNFIFPDRVKVIHVKKQKGSLPRKVSLEKKQLVAP
jgi:hypothetical protein